MLTIQYAAGGQTYQISPNPALALADETWTQTLNRLASTLLPAGVTAFTLVDPATAAPTVAELLAYAAGKRAFIEGGAGAASATLNIASAGSAPINIDVDLSPAGQTRLAGAVMLSWLNPSQVFQWVNNDGALVSLAAAQVQTLGQSVGAFVQATFVTLAAINAAIGATPPTVTTFAQIDAPAAPLPAWPTA